MWASFKEDSGIPEIWESNPSAHPKWREGELEEGSPDAAVNLFQLELPLRKEKGYAYY